MPPSAGLTRAGRRRMSGSVLHFTPNAELAPHQNMLAFINVCRKSAVLGASGQFDKDIWDNGYRKGQSHQTRILFTTLEGARQARPKPTPAVPEPFLPEPFSSFAKACLVYLHDRKPVVNQAPRIAALRYLEAALRQLSRGSRPTAVDIQVLEAATELIVNGGVYDNAYAIANCLITIVDTMQDSGIVQLRDRWHHQLKAPYKLRSRISADALAARQEKLPSAAGLRAIAGIFNAAEGVGDSVVASYCALMLCAPERVNEVLRLQTHCLVEGDGRFAGKLGIRWPGSKRSLDTTKWLPTNMVPTAREAISRLTASSAKAREIAAWYEANPDSLFLHDGVRHLRGAIEVTAAEVGQILWGHEDGRGVANAWLKSQGIRPLMADGRQYRYRFSFADVERAVLKKLPATFPFVPGAGKLKCVDSLGLVLKNALTTERAVWLCMFQTVDQNDLNYRLAGHLAVKSIFERHGYTEDDGGPIEITSHAFRHYLNMLGQVGGLSDVEIAIFSGRKDVRQNRAYDHRTSVEVQAPIVQATRAGFRGNLIAPVGRQLLERDELMASGRPASHTTPYGYCMLDFAAEPCSRHRDCLDCDEQECVKGERHKEDNLRRKRDETAHALARARAALDDEEYGADEWVKHHLRTLARVDELLAIVENPHVPAGARIRLVAGGAPQIMGAFAVAALAEADVGGPRAEELLRLTTI